MFNKISRRQFIKKSSTIGASSIIGGNLLSRLLKNSSVYASEKIDISVVQGENYYANTVKAVHELGGMGKFVRKNAKVAILPNAQRNNPGAFTKPDIVRAVINLCKEAGAKEVNCLSWLGKQNWENTGLAQAIEEAGANLVLVDNKYENLYRAVAVKNGVALNEARIMKELYKNDVLITMPITKDHAGNKFTGTLKNMMALNFSKSNRTFHKENWQTDINSIRHLDQCIADLNTVVQPDLCIVDATEFITTNGPFGPGKLLKPQKVVAGTDRVAIDAYCCSLWGLKAKDIIMINKAYEHQIGEMDLMKVNIKEMTL